MVLSFRSIGGQWVITTTDHTRRPGEVDVFVRASGGNPATMRRRAYTEDDVDLEYLATARSTNRLKNALMDNLDESFTKSRTADKRLLKDIDNRLSEPRVNLPDSDVVNANQHIRQTYTFRKVPKAPGVSNYIVLKKPGKQVMLVKAPVRASSVPRALPSTTASTDVVATTPIFTKYGPVEIPTRKVKSKTTVYKYPGDYRTGDKYLSGNGTEVSWRKRLLTTYDYNPPAPKTYDDMRTMLKYAHDKLDSHKQITDSYADHDLGYGVLLNEKVGKPWAKPMKRVPKGAPVSYNYSRYDKPESTFSEPPVSDLRRRIRGVISKAKGNPNYYREY